MHHERKNQQERGARLKGKHNGSCSGEQTNLNTLYLNEISVSFRGNKLGRREQDWGKRVKP